MHAICDVYCVYVRVHLFASQSCQPQIPAATEAPAAAGAAPSFSPSSPLTVALSWQQGGLTRGLVPCPCYFVLFAVCVLFIL